MIQMVQLEASIDVTTTLLQFTTPQAELNSLLCNLRRDELLTSGDAVDVLAGSQGRPFAASASSVTKDTS